MMLSVIAKPIGSGGFVGGLIVVSAIRYLDGVDLKCYFDMRLVRLYNALFNHSRVSMLVQMNESICEFGGLVRGAQSNSLKKDSENK